jgi:Purine nucleoside phosphorylase
MLYTKYFYFVCSFLSDSMTFKNTALTVIGGVGYGDLKLGKRQKIKTDYGDVSYSVFQTKNSSEIIFISRHQGKHHVPPHEINFCALIMAARKIGAPVLSLNSVGLMRPVLLTNKKDKDDGNEFVGFDNFSKYPFFIPNDFIDFTKNRVNTFYNHQTVHTDMSDPYCLSVRNLLKTVLSGKNISFSEGNYLCTEGPRFETKAEIQMFSNFSDVVGMTGVPEVVLAKEVGLCYASLCVITNPAAGLSQNTLTSDELKLGVNQTQNEVFSILSELADLFSEIRSGNSSSKSERLEKCRCKESSSDGRL